jgi:hypothetical protein
MEADQHHAPTRSSSWKHLAVRALAGGFGLGVGIAVVFVIVYSYSTRPRGWRTDALGVKKVIAEGMFAMDENLEEKSTGTTFTVDVENTTDADITLPQSLTVMQAAKGTGALHGSLLKLSKEYFIPAHHVVSISLDNSDLCAAHVDGKQCFDTYFKDQSEIVLFVEGPKYEIRIAVPPFTPPRPTGASVPVQLP